MHLQDFHKGIVRCIAAAVIAGGCGGTENETETDGASESSSTSASEACVAVSAPTWESFGQEFFATYCNHCHSETLKGDARNDAPFDHNFDTAELVRMQVKRIAGVAAGGPDGINNSMPLGEPKPSDEERVMLGEWLACGAP